MALIGLPNKQTAARIAYVLGRMAYLVGWWGTGGGEVRPRHRNGSQQPHCVLHYGSIRKHAAGVGPWDGTQCLLRVQCRWLQGLRQCMPHRLDPTLHILFLATSSVT